MRTDSDPSDQLNEAVQAALFTQHPYGKPIIGWGHEIEGLDRTDALAYYDRFYTPENAILVVAGDVEPTEVIALAEKIYGPIPARGEAPKRVRPREPEPRAHRRVTLADEKVEQPSYQAVYLAPSYRTAAPGVGEALEVLSHLLGGGNTSLLFKKLVMEQKIAVAAGAHYQGAARRRHALLRLRAAGAGRLAGDGSRPPPTRSSPRSSPMASTRPTSVAPRRGSSPTPIYAQDSQATLARWYGASLATGLSIDDVAAWPARIEAVTLDDVRNAARWLDKRRSVTGFLLPAAGGERAGPHRCRSRHGRGLNLFTFWRGPSAQEKHT